MKTNTGDKNIAVYVMMAVIVLVAGFFLHRLICILESKACRMTGNVVSVTLAGCTNQVAVSAGNIGEIQKLQDRSPAIMEAYESLSNELSSWMAIMGIFAAVFGLLIPIGSYFLQRQSLKDERETIMKDVEKTRDEAFVKINEFVDGVPAEIGEKMKPMWNFLAANFDRFLVNDGMALCGNGISDWRMVANFVIGFDICLDCLVRAHNAGRVLEVVIKYQELLTSVQERHPKEWQYVVDQLKDKMRPSKEFVTGREYAAVIGSDSEIYVWLKNFYGQFAPWKFA